jgi:hypothetical protein
VDVYSKRTCPRCRGAAGGCANCEGDGWIVLHTTQWSKQPRPPVAFALTRGWVAVGALCNAALWFALGSWVL